eukprot:COSAG01_NODE_3796_length_5688_cov_4.251208_4_plen_82_part_00
MNVILKILICCYVISSPILFYLTAAMARERRLMQPNGMFWDPVHKMYHIFVQYKTQVVGGSGPEYWCVRFTAVHSARAIRQ